MLVNNDTNMLRGIKLLDQNITKTYVVIDRVWLLVMSVFLWLLEWFTKLVAQTGKWKASTDLLSFMYEYIQVFKWEACYFIGYFTKSIYLFSGIYEIIFILLSSNTDQQHMFRGQGSWFKHILFFDTIHVNIVTHNLVKRIGMEGKLIEFLSLDKEVVYHCTLYICDF